MYFPQQTEEKGNDGIELIYSYLIHWKWFLAITVLAFLGAYIYIRITKPVYQATAAIAIFDTEDDDRESNDFFSGSIRNLSLTGNRLEDEKVVLTSRYILLRVVESMNMYDDFDGDSLRALAHCRSNLSVASASKNGSVLNITFTDTEPERGREILETLIKEYNLEALSHRRRMAQAMISFLDERLLMISNSLGYTEQSVQSYKTQEQLIDLRTNMSMDLNAKQNYEDKLMDVEIQLHMSNYIYEFLNNQSKQYQLLPINSGVLRTEVSEMIGNYNQQVLERERMLKTMEERNPVVVKQTETINAIRRNLLSSVEGLREGLEMSRNEIMGKSEYFNLRVKNMPKHEQQVQSMNRHQQLESSLYMILLEQRERARIELAISTDRVRIIEEPMYSVAPIAPRSTVIYGGSLLMGWIAVAGVIFLRNMLRKKIVTLNEIEEVGLPIVAKLPFIKRGDRSEKRQLQVLDEAFRRMRSNVRAQLPVDAKTILITSAGSNEGKTFCSIRLAKSLSLLDCRVLLVGLDLRNPQIGKFFGEEDKIGIADYLSGKVSDPEELIHPVKDSFNLFVVTAGTHNEQSAELLERNHLNALFECFRLHFDYIVIDSAPIGLVVDTFSLLRVTDYTLFVSRIGHTDRHMTEILSEMKNNGWETEKMAMIVNCVNHTEGYYYHHHRYYYYYYRRYSHYE